MKKFFTSILTMVIASSLFAQTNPAITSWLLNTTGIQGSHYVSGNSTAVNDNVDANVQLIQYSADWAYINATGIPAYTTGPFLDNNPSVATNQDAIFQFSLNPTQNTGTLTSTTGGNIGNFINGVALFDWRDGVAWNSNTNALCGGPGNATCPGGPMATQDWNRDAVPAEMPGFDCSKAHPAGGNYHHHQNPSAFNLDLVEVSNVCDLYVSDGLYAMSSTEHSPLIGFAYDGFPIYGAFAYTNTDGTGAITRMKSGYSLRNMTTRTNGPTVDFVYTITSGPNTGNQETLNLGYFKEDYEYIASMDPDVLDEHNGRFCITPEYPNGIYCYFATVDADWNSAYPYVVGPTYYGNVTSGSVTTINETVTEYVPAEDTTVIIDTTTTNILVLEESLEINVFPNPIAEVVAIQLPSLAKESYTVDLLDYLGRKINTATIKQGSTITHIDTRTLYSGSYIITVSKGNKLISTKNIVIKK
jgi:hypothetical protein